jgi:thiamine-phosphate pyrophosphorylase
MQSLASRSLYLCVGMRADMETFLAAVLRGGVDVVQLREKQADDQDRRAMALRMVPLCHDFGVPFIMNDSPELAADVGADGVHVGQDDASVARCRELLGDEAIVGLSTHEPAEFAEGLLAPVSYLSAGPIVPTPTKLGRPGTGVDYALTSQAQTALPVFVTGGVNEATVGELVTRGLRHFVVVRALTEAVDPETTARRLRQAIDTARSAMAIEPPQ